MYLVLVFWLVFALPGFVVVRRFWQEDLESGLFGAIGLSYLAAFALVSPVAIVGYAACAPLWVLTAYIVVLIAASVVEITRRRWWKDAAMLLRSALGFELLVIALDLVVGARTGTLLAGDARVHVARIRFLLDHGLSNLDPFVAAAHPFPIYHTNLLHAVFASACRLTSTQAFEAWFISLPLGKLLFTCGTYYVVWTLVGRKWPALVAAMFCIGNRGAINYLIYPNQLAPFFLLPLAMAFVLRALRGERPWARAAQLFAISLILGQLHSLYVLFTLLCVGPALGVGAIAALLRRRPERWALVAATVVLLAGAPFGLVAKREMAPITPPSEAFQQKAQAQTDQEFPPVFGNQRIRAPADLPRLFGCRQWGGLIVLAALAGLYALTRRKEVLLFATFPVMALAAFYIPPLCTLIRDVLGDNWIFKRLDAVFILTFIVVVPACAAAFLERRAPTGRVVRILGSAAALFVAVFYVPEEPPWTWRITLKTAVSGADQRHGVLRYFSQLQEALSKHVPTGETVLAEPVLVHVMAMVYDCRLVASYSASNGVPDLIERRRDAFFMLEPDTPWPQRRALLERYRVRYLVPSGGQSYDWLRGHVDRAWQADVCAIVRLKLD